MYTGAKRIGKSPIVQDVPLKRMREAFNVHHRYTSPVRDRMRRKNSSI